jgi:hypothetical protein
MLRVIPQLTAAPRTASAPAMRRSRPRLCRSIHKACPDPRLIEHAKRAWDRRCRWASDGFRNAQVSVIAPTGTIGS